MSFPAFVGMIGRSSSISFAQNSVWMCVWNFAQPEVALWVRNRHEGREYYSNSGNRRETGAAVFVWGNPLVATDCEFEANTRVERIPLTRLPDKIARLYEQHGTRAFAFLEGNFSLVVADRASQSILLVVDKFGCDDLYIRRDDQDVAFASHPSFVTAPDQRFNSTGAAFFLAHEGFVPAPFTLFQGIETVGRAKCLRIKMGAEKISVESERYWYPSRCKAGMLNADAVQRFHMSLARAVEPRLQTHNGILLSGGIDSALLANLIVRENKRKMVAMTGMVLGSAESEREVYRAASVASALGLPHHVVRVNPRDDALPQEWMKCVGSWSGGTRVTLPMFYRFAVRMREMYGADYSAFSGQMADTLADNNYTLPSLGYTMRRMFFSSWFLKILPFLGRVAPRKESRGKGALIRMTKLLAGPRLSKMLESLLDGMSSETRFYEGRLFGFGEMPGRSHKGFPFLTREGFHKIADWYSSNFVAPVSSQLDKETFYAKMFELSMDMVMLHLDTRLVLHAFRLGGGNAELPFLDSRVVKVLTSLMYSTRAFYRKPKYVIEAQFRKHSYARAVSGGENKTQRQPSAKKSKNAASFEQLLLAGSLGSYFRELLAQCTALNVIPGLNEFVDEAYIERQLRAFQRGLDGVDCKFISRLAALEFWSQSRRNEVALE